MSYLQKNKKNLKNLKKQKLNRAKFYKQRARFFIKKNQEIVCITPIEPQTKKKDEGEPMNRTEVIEAISLYILSCILKNDRKNNSTCTPSLFDSPNPSTTPSLSTICELITTIVTRRRLAAESVVIALVLLERTRIKITSRNWERMVMVSLLLANKEAEDVYSVWNVRFVGFIPGLQVYEINYLEMEFLQYIQYRLHVEQNHYLEYYSLLFEILPERIPEETEIEITQVVKEVEVEAEVEEIEVEEEVEEDLDELPEVDEIEEDLDELPEVDEIEDENDDEIAEQVEVDEEVQEEDIEDLPEVDEFDGEENDEEDVDEDENEEVELSQDDVALEDEEIQTVEEFEDNQEIDDDDQEREQADDGDQQNSEENAQEAEDNDQQNVGENEQYEEEVIHEELNEDEAEDEEYEQEEESEEEYNEYEEDEYVEYTEECEEYDYEGGYYNWTVINAWNPAIAIGQCTKAI